MRTEGNIRVASPGSDLRRRLRRGLVVALAAVTAGIGVVAAAQGKPGTLEVRFFFDTPSNIEPTYHTAIWLEDGKGNLVKTLYVSQELSGSAYKVGEACPDWVSKAEWDKAPESDVAAVTAPTPNVGAAEMAFDLAALKIAPGTYGFRFQVHVTEQYNLLYRGDVNVGGEAAALTLETAFGPGKLDTTEQFVRDVDVRYVPAR